jgi:uncharacterized protein YciU (UPF0263 family)
MAKRKVTIKKLAELVGVQDKQLYKLKDRGVITPDGAGEYPYEESIQNLFDFYRKGGDADVQTQLFLAKLEKEKAGAEILKTKEKRLKRTLVDFDLVKKDFADISIQVRNRLLDVGDKIARSVLACQTTDEARKLIKLEITACLSAISDLRPERYDGVTDEEIENPEVEEVEESDGG